MFVSRRPSNSLSPWTTAVCDQSGAVIPPVLSVFSGLVFDFCFLLFLVNIFRNKALSESQFDTHVNIRPKLTTVSYLEVGLYRESWIAGSDGNQRERRVLAQHAETDFFRPAGRARNLEKRSDSVTICKSSATQPGQAFQACTTFGLADLVA